MQKTPDCGSPGFLFIYNEAAINQEHPPATFFFLPAGLGPGTLAAGDFEVC